MNIHIQPRLAPPAISIAESADRAGSDAGLAIQIHRRPAAEKRPELPSCWPLADDGHPRQPTGADQEREAIDRDQVDVVQRDPIAEDSEATGESEPGNQPIASDYQRPPALDAVDEFIFNEESPLAETYPALGHLLAASGDIFRKPTYTGGLFLASPDINVPPTLIDNAAKLVAVIADRLRITYRRNGKIVGRRIPVSHANTMLQSEILPAAVPTHRRIGPESSVHGEFPPHCAGLQRRRSRSTLLACRTACAHRRRT